MRASYIPQVREREEETLKEQLVGKKVGVLADETTNRNGQCVFIILIKPLECNDSPKLFVGGVKILENANARECSRAIMECINHIGIKFEDVVFIASDSARYMTKCFQTMSGLLGDSLLHIQCWAHKLNLVGNICQIELPQLNECVTKVKMAFLNTRKRRNEYQYFLKERHPDKTAKLFPAPVMTRWNSWHNSVQYIEDYLMELVEFFKSLGEGGAAVQYFQQLSNDAVSLIQCQATFIVEHCSATVDMIQVLEGNSYPYAHKIVSKISDLTSSFGIVGEGHFGTKTEEALTISRLKTVVKHGLTEQLKSVGLKSKLKLTSLLATDPAKMFFKSMGKLFDLRCISNITCDDIIKYGSRVPFLANLPKKIQLEGHATLKGLVGDLVSEGKDVSLVTVLLSMRADHPQYVEGVTKALWIPASNVDSERAFSSYGNILTDRRTTLKPENIELMLSMTFGTN